MKCPDCQCRLKTKDTRDMPGYITKRKKVCPCCGKVVKTIEGIAENRLNVVKFAAVK